MTDLQDSVMLLLTGALVVATSVYAWTTWKLFEESRLSRKVQQDKFDLDILPKIKIGTKWYGVSLDTYIVNVGQYPITDLKITISLKLKDGSSLTPIGPSRMSLNLLLPNERQEFYVPKSQFDNIKKDFYSIGFTGTCKDIRDNLHQIKDELVFDLPDVVSDPEKQIWLVSSDDDPMKRLDRLVHVASGIPDELKKISSNIEKMGKENKKE